MRMTSIGLAVSLALVAPYSLGAEINIDSPGGDTGASSFTWQGLTFVLDDQPGSAENAPHRVAGDSDGEVSLFLEQPGKVSYRAVLPDFTDAPSRYTLGFRYGEDLEQSTPEFSNLTGFYRRLYEPEEGDTVEIVQQLLAGSDQGNDNSVFYGTTGRTAAGGSMGNQNFLNELGFGVDGLFEMLVDPDGTASTTVTADGVAGSADFTVNLTPGDEVDPFAFNELLLQVESFQGADSFAQQFGETGQQFTFTSASVSTVPLPATLALFAGGLLGLMAMMRSRARD